jgi:hypothetical protein
VNPSPTNGASTAARTARAGPVLGDERATNRGAVLVEQADGLVDVVDDDQGHLGAVLPLPLGAELRR